MSGRLPGANALGSYVGMSPNSSDPFTCHVQVNSWNSWGLPLKVCFATRLALTAKSTVYGAQVSMESEIFGYSMFDYTRREQERYSSPNSSPNSQRPILSFEGLGLVWTGFITRRAISIG